MNLQSIPRLSPIGSEFGQKRANGMCFPVVWVNQGTANQAGPRRLRSRLGQQTSHPLARARRAYLDEPM